MKKLLLSAVSMAVLTGAATAADLPTRREPLAPAPEAPGWNGFYAGLNAGGTWTTNNNAQISYRPVYSDVRNNAAGIVSNIVSILSSYSVPTSSASGFAGGGQIGYNESIGTNYLFGIETDFQGLADQNSQSPVALRSVSFGFYSNALQKNTIDSLSNLVKAHKNVSALGTARMRLGYLFTPAILIYLTGGLAYGPSNHNTFALQDLETPITDEIGPGGAGNSVFRLGWTAGGGAEWMIMNNWSVKAEYLYYDLGTTSMYIGQGIGVQRIQTATSQIPVGQIAQMRSAYSNMHFTGKVIRAGVNYHFNFASAPVVATF